ncbi:MAG: GWxTD domain-containing protein, partial [Terriglobia bacterium]
MELRKGFPSFLSLLLTGGLLLAGSGSAGAAPRQQEDENRKKQRPLGEGLPRRELSKKERERREKALRKELESHYKKWLQEDVVYIITPEERKVFKRLNTEEEREQFVEQFWLRRDPTPDTIENEYREEHYRRIAYVNERFGSGKPGWKTDRGRIYITWGPPDEIESRPSGGTYFRPEEEGGGSTATYPFERWRYRYLEGVGQDIILEFIDPTLSGEYRMTMDPSEKDALLHVPGAGLSRLEELGLASKTQRFQRTDGTHLPTTYRDMGGPTSDAFDRMEIYSSVMRPPPVKFKDLEELVTTRISFNLLPFEFRTDFLRITAETILVPVTIALQKKNLTFQMDDGIHRGVVNVFGRITTLTGRIVQTFEDVIQ